MSKLETKFVNDIAGKFFVPSYQRGYRNEFALLQRENYTRISVAECKFNDKFPDARRNVRKRIADFCPPLPSIGVFRRVQIRF